MSSATRAAPATRACADCGGPLDRPSRRAIRCASCSDLRAIDARARAWARRAFGDGPATTPRAKGADV